MENIKPFKDQEYDRLQRHHNAENLFVDHEFPPALRTLSHTGRKFHDLKWRRARDIVQNPQFVIKSFHRGDLDQGELGNCWFLAAVGAVTLHPDLLERVVPPNQSFDKYEYGGIFHFRFWINGQWYDVVIDDFLPCRSDGSLVFCRNRIEKNEMWGPLLEKAYAKVCGSYEVMESGSSVEGLIDMSGGIDEEFSIHDSKQREFNSKEELKHFVLQAYEHRSMIGCAINAERGGIRNSGCRSEGRLSSGLLAGHAYSITSVTEVHTNSGCELIVRCLNPWGDETEWNGRFSDRSTVWNEVDDDEKQRLKLRERNDGEFWMSFDDFFDNFDRLSICHRPPYQTQASGMSTWNEVVFHGQWIPGLTAAGCGNDDNRNFYKNPQYLINIDSGNHMHDHCTVMVALMQKNSRQRRMHGIQESSIGFALYKVNDNVNIHAAIDQGDLKFNTNQVERVDSSGHYVNNKQVTKRFTVPPGIYVLIPSTYHPNEEGEFLLRVFTENKVNGEELDHHQGQYDYSNDYYPDQHRDVPNDYHDGDQNTSTDSSDEPCSIM